MSVTCRDSRRSRNSESLKVGSNMSIYKKLMFYVMHPESRTTSLIQTPCFKEIQTQAEFTSFVWGLKQIIMAKNLAVLTRCPVLFLLFNGSFKRTGFNWKVLILEIFTLRIKCFHNIGKCSSLKLSSVLLYLYFNKN